MAENGCFAVWFNKEALQYHGDLVKKKLTSLPFKDFVKAAFHDKLDSMNIEKITWDQVAKATKKSSLSKEK